MQQFAEWFLIAECLEDLIESDVSLSEKLTKRIQDILRVKDALDWSDVLKVIRHEFTNYDGRLRGLDSVRELCTRLKTFNQIVEETHEKVIGIVTTYLKPASHRPLIAASERWKEGHWKELPKHCQEEENPLAWRARRSGIGGLRG